MCGLVATSLMLAAGCGSSKTYDVADVQRAFDTAGIRLIVLQDFQEVAANTADDRFDDAARHAPKVLGRVDGVTNDIALFVYPSAREAEIYERQLARNIAMIRAHPDRYKNTDVPDTGITRSGNVVVGWNKSKPDLSRRVTAGIAELR